MWLKKIQISFHGTMKLLYKQRYRFCKPFLFYCCFFSWVFLLNCYGVYKQKEAKPSAIWWSKTLKSTKSNSIVPLIRVTKILWGRSKVRCGKAALVLFIIEMYPLKTACHKKIITYHHFSQAVSPNTSPCLERMWCMHKQVPSTKKASDIFNVINVRFHIEYIE